MQHITIISYDELALKSWNIRKKFVLKLASNLKIALKSWNLSNTAIRNEWDKLFIDTSSLEESTRAARVASKVFGVDSAAPAVYTKFTDLKDVIHHALEFTKGYIFPDDRFLLDVKFKGESFSRNDFITSLRERIESEIPGSKGETSSHNRELHLYGRGEHVYYYAYKFPGPGGFPLGTNGKAVCLVSGGIDSPVASWLMMKRGVHPIFVHFATALDGSTEGVTITKEKIRKLVDDWGYSKTPIKFYIIPYGDVLSTFKGGIIDEYTCVFCKRHMLRIANRIALKEKAQALVTGDNIGQVASQTAWNLIALDQASDLPVYRPLISFNKRETIDLARKIGTFGETIPQPGCCQAVPDSPVIKAEENIIKQEEKQIDSQSLIDKALEKAIIDTITPL
ncbi:MAG: tRNA sulfurtransferase [Candidatus Odinarchaeota archaeon]